MILERETGHAVETFKADPNLRELTKILARLGYDWDLVSIAPLRNTYDVVLQKQGSRFFLSRASSGEKELLTYLFIIFALDVCDVLILVRRSRSSTSTLRWRPTFVRVFEDLRQNGKSIVIIPIST